ncbi:hypothetical protein Tco_1439996 [Tanacetum coccineum]
MPVELRSFDAIIGMDWLANHHSAIVCDEKIVRIPYGDEVLIVQGDRDSRREKSKLSIISCAKTHKYVEKGCLVFLAQVTKKETEDKSEEKRLEDVPTVRDFSEVFPDDLLGLPPKRQVKFQIDLVPGAAPVARARYRLKFCRTQILANTRQLVKTSWFTVMLPCKGLGARNSTCQEQNSQAEIVSEEQLVPRANRLFIKKNNQRIPTPDPNNTYTKPPSEIQILKFIKTLGYDEDPKTKTKAISKMVTTILHQPWRAILSVLNRILTGKDLSWDTNVPHHSRNDCFAKKTRLSDQSVEEETVVGELAHSISIQEPRTQPRQRSQLTIDRKSDKAVADMYNEWGQKLKGLAVDDPIV